MISYACGQERRLEVDDITQGARSDAEERLLGLYALVSPGASASQHSVTMELRRSTLVRLAADNDDEAISAVLDWIDRRQVHLIELGGGWSHHGVAALAEAVGDKSIVTARWFPHGELPDNADVPIRRANVFFCSTPDTAAFLETPRDLIWFAGILDPEDGVKTCKRLVTEEGVRVIEICSDWGFDGAASVQEAVGPGVRVGLSLHQALDAARRAQQLYVPPPFAQADTRA